jgi:hypothetical protein
MRPAIISIEGKKGFYNAVMDITSHEAAQIP